MDVITRICRKRGAKKTKLQKNPSALAKYSTIMTGPSKYAFPAAPVNVHALNCATNAEQPAIHQSILPPPRK